MTAPKIAMPTVEPTLRKNWVDAVATPMSERETAFCTTRVYCCIAMPRPMPRTTIASVSCRLVAAWSRRASRKTPTAMIAMPVSMKGRYLPVRVMSIPVRMPQMMKPSMSGMRIRPELVALTPMTPCAKTGM